MPGLLAHVFGTREALDSISHKHCAVLRCYREFSEGRYHYEATESAKDSLRELAAQCDGFGTKNALKLKATIQIDIDNLSRR